MIRSGFFTWVSCARSREWRNWSRRAACSTVTGPSASGSRSSARLAWEGWRAPDEEIDRSPHVDLIERVDRYVSDAELSASYGQADAVVLPYHRSSASGPLQRAMSTG